MGAVGRNDPCSCGSGKKYKKCCLGVPPDVPSRDGQQDESPDPFLDNRPTEVKGIDFDLPDMVAPGERHPVNPRLRDAVRDFLTRNDGIPIDPEDFTAFLEPVLSRSDPESEREWLPAMLMVGCYLWMLAALNDPAVFRQRLDQLIDRMHLSPGAQTERFKWVAARMHQRHRLLFPHLHQEVQPSERPNP